MRRKEIIYSLKIPFISPLHLLDKPTVQYIKMKHGISLIFPGI